MINTLIPILFLLYSKENSSAIFERALNGLYRLCIPYVAYLDFSYVKKSKHVLLFIIIVIDLRVTCELSTLLMITKYSSW